MSQMNWDRVHKETQEQRNKRSVVTPAKDGGSANRPGRLRLHRKPKAAMPQRPDVPVRTHSELKDFYREMIGDEHPVN